MGKIRIRSRNNKNLWLNPEQIIPDPQHWLNGAHLVDLHAPQPESQAAAGRARHLGILGLLLAHTRPVPILPRTHFQICGNVEYCSQILSAFVGLN